MKAQDILKAVSKLSFDDKQTIIKSLSDSLFINDLDKQRTEHTGIRPSCPSCPSNEVIKNGSQNKVQKFRCKDCGKSFNLHTGTAIHWLHNKQEWFRFIELTIESKSIRAISNELNRSKQTVFNWRHKLLSSLDGIFQKEFRGIVEMDDMILRVNQKGRVKNFKESLRRSKTVNGYTIRKRFVKRGISGKQLSVLFTIDRYKSIDMTLLKMGKIDRKSLERVLDNGLVDRLNKENVIVTDGCRSYNKLLSGYKHERLVIRNGEKVRGHYHLNTLNGYSGKFKGWVAYNFVSVSTKYLQNYLNYFKMLFFVLGDGNRVSELLGYSLKDVGTISRYRGIENEYLRLLDV